MRVRCPLCRGLRPGGANNRPYSNVYADRDGDIDQHRHRDTDGNPHGDLNRDGDSDGHCNSNLDRYPDAYGDSDTFANADPDPAAAADLYPDAGLRPTHCHAGP